MTTVLVEVTSCLVPQVDAAATHVGVARAHRPTGFDDVCSACGWHWPCPEYFHARRWLIAAGVHPNEWA